MFNLPTQSLSSKLGYKNGAVPQVLSFPFPQNADIVDDVVTEILGKHLLSIGRTLCTKTLKSWRQRKLRDMKNAYAKHQLGKMWRAFTPSDVLKSFTKDISVNFAKLTREQMIEYTNTHILPFLKL